MTRPGLAQAASIVRRGGVAAIPFEAQYGLAALALDDDAVRRVLDIKTRDARSPLPIVIPDGRWLDDLVEDIPPIARDLMNRFWPGPLTIVLKARPDLPAGVISGAGKVGVRVPGPCPAAEILRLVDMPLTATSANVSGEAPALSDGDVRRCGIGTKVDLVLPGKVSGGAPSTVVAIEGNRVRILRPGAVSLEGKG